jgi:hypothetical protein
MTLIYWTKIKMPYGLYENKDPTKNVGLDLSQIKQSLF